jgi:hypothetical protein
MGDRGEKKEERSQKMGEVNYAAEGQNYGAGELNQRAGDKE